MSSPFTDRQNKLLNAFSKKIREIEDPDPPILTNQFCEWTEVTLKEIGTIPKPVLKPFPQQIKAEIMRAAGLDHMVSDKGKEKRRNNREKVGFRQQYKLRDVSRLAQNFDKVWQEIAVKLKSWFLGPAIVNHLFMKPDEQIAEPIQMYQSILMTENTATFKLTQEDLKKAYAAQQRYGEPQDSDASALSYEEKLDRVR